MVVNKCFLVVGGVVADHVGDSAAMQWSCVLVAFQLFFFPVEPA